MYAAFVLSAVLAALSSPIFTGVGHAEPTGLARYEVEPEWARVLERPEPEWAARGVRAGSFVLYPQLAATAGYDDNIFATRTDAVDDGVATIEPQVRLQSDWGRNALDLVAAGTLSRYADHTNQNSNQYSVAATGVLNAHHDLTIEARASEARILLPRTADSYALFSATPLLYDQGRASLDVVKVFGRLRTSATVTFETIRYLGGRSSSDVAIDYGFRDRDGVTLDVRADYDIGRKTAVFVREIYTHSRHNRTLYRLQDTEETLAGLDLQPTHHIIAELALGVLATTYSTPSDTDTLTPDGRATVVYSPTRRLTITLTGEHGLVDSGIPTSPAYDSTTAAAQADYELKRNITLTARLGAIFNSYRVIDRRDRTFDAQASATYRLNRGMELALSFAHTRRSSNGAGGEASGTAVGDGTGVPFDGASSSGAAGRAFDDNVVSLALTLRR